jgi:hypothetical protein
MEEQPLPSAKLLPVKSTQASLQVVQEQTLRLHHLSPALTQHKQKTEAAKPITAARKPGKKKPTVRQVAMVSQSQRTGLKSETPARKTCQHAK